MAKLKVKRGLYLQYRFMDDGTPVFRWGHAPGLRRKGILPFDLRTSGTPLSETELAKHGLKNLSPPLWPDGSAMLCKKPARPMTKREAEIAAQRLKDHLPQMDDTSAPKPVAPTARPPGQVRTVGDLLDEFFSPRNKRLMSRKKKTIDSYKSWRPPIDEIFADEPLANMSEDLIEDWFHTMKEIRGHRMAYGSYQLLRRAWNWGRRPFPMHEILWKEIDTPRYSAKLRVATDAELAALMLACDDPIAFCSHYNLPPENLPPARPAIGDSIIVALWTVQRAIDVLSFTEERFASGRLRMRSSKNNTRIDMPIMPPLLNRLRDAHRRKQQSGYLTDAIVINANTGRPYSQKTHNKHWNEQRKLAARACPSLLGQGEDDFGDAIPVFTFEDLRDTGITRLARAGCTIEQIISWSNHQSPESLRQLIDSYIALDGEIADQAGALMMDYITTNNIAI